MNTEELKEIRLNEHRGIERNKAEWTLVELEMQNSWSILRGLRNCLERNCCSGCDAGRYQIPGTCVSTASLDWKGGGRRDGRRVPGYGSLAPIHQWQLSGDLHCGLLWNCLSCLFLCMYALRPCRHRYWVRCIRNCHYYHHCLHWPPCRAAVWCDTALGRWCQTAAHEPELPSLPPQLSDGQTHCSCQHKMDG